MPTMPERISKGPIIQRMDEVFAYREPDNRGEILRMLQDGLPLADIGERIGVLRTRPRYPGEFTGDEMEQTARRRGVIFEAPGVPRELVDERAHILLDWFTPSDGGGYWDAHPVEEIIRNGLVEALDMAIRLRLPVDTAWICGGRENRGIGRRVQCFVHWNAHQVSLVVLTPLAPYHVDGSPLPKGLMDAFKEQRKAALVIKADDEGRLDVAPLVEGETATDYSREQSS